MADVEWMRILARRRPAAYWQMLKKQLCEQHWNGAKHCPPGGVQLPPGSQTPPMHCCEQHSPHQVHD
jgi:hypothetical protein